MGVLASKIIDGDSVIRNWECGSFDLMGESDPANGWVEISRDCDSWPGRRTLYPYASGMHTGGTGVQATSLDSGVPFRKYFSNTTDTILTDLDFSDINSGVLPSTPCSQMTLYQNGVKIPCEAFSVDYSLSTITINGEWQVPGAAYEAIYFAPTGGVSGGS